MRLLAPVFEPAELATLQDELELLDSGIEEADRESRDDQALGLRRQRCRATLAIWGRQDLGIAMALDAALRRAAEGLDAETLDHLADKLRPPGVGEPGSRGTA